MATARSPLRNFLFPVAPTPPATIVASAQDDKWTISQERTFMEDLVYKRLTLFLAIAAALTTGAINLREDLAVSVPLLVLGTILCWVLQQTIHRAQLKLDIILKILFADKKHPAGYVDAILNDESRVRWVGYLVPSTICVLMTGLVVVEAILLLYQLIAPSEAAAATPCPAPSART